MAFTLYGYENNPRTRIVRIVAAAEEIPLNHFEVIPRRNIGKAGYLSKFPLSRGKIPGLEGPDRLRLTETLAITTYLASLHNRQHLLGDGTPSQTAQVLSWMSWANQELLQTLALWFLPLIPNFTDPPPYSYESIEKGKAASLGMLDALEESLQGKDFLVGTRVTLADIFVAVVVSRGVEWVLGRRWREDHTAIVRHLEMVGEIAWVRSVIPEFKKVEVEPGNKDPYEKRVS